MRKIISLFLLVFMLAGFVPVYASPVDDNGNDAIGNTDVETVKGSSWGLSQSGYRITVVDNNKKVVATVVDFLFSDPTGSFGSGNKYFYTNSRFTGASSSRKGWTYVTFDTLKSLKQIDKEPSRPIYTDKKGDYKAGGAEFRDWFLKGAHGMDITYVPQKPKPTYSSPKAVETGTTRPVSGSTGYKTGGTNGTSGGPTGYNRVSDQPGGYRGSAMVTNISLRTTVLNGAKPILKDQGYLEGAESSARSVSKSTLLIFEREVKAGKSRSVAMGTAINALVMNANYLGRSIAEQNYIAAVALNYFLGTGRNSSNTPRLTQTISDNGLRLDKVPAAGEDNYYIDEVMNSKVDGRYVFQFNGVGVTSPEGMNSTTDPLEFIQNNNFAIVVEPVFWFRPAEWKGGRKTNEQPYYMYGTVNNLVNHYTNVLGWSRGGAYDVLTSHIGWSSMYMGGDWKDQSGSILLRGVTTSGAFSVGAKNHGTISGWINGGYAVATHVYKTSVEDTQVTGHETWNTPMAAPDPKDLRVKSGRTKKYNIVKYYEDHESGSVIHRFAPLYRVDNPPKIKIVDELGYRVEDWFVTRTNVRSGAPATYAGAKTGYANAISGNDLRTLSLGDDELTLVVKLVSDDDPVTTIIGGGEDFVIELPESKISINGSTSSNMVIPKLRNYALPVFGRNVKYVLKNIMEVDKKVEANTSIWKPKMTGNTKSGNGGTLSDPRYDTLIHRGYDNLTLYSPWVSSSSKLKGIYSRYGIVPGGDRGSNSGYKAPLDFEFSVKETAGLTEDEKLGVESLMVNGAAVVKTYRGVRTGKAVGNKFVDTEFVGLGIGLPGVTGNNGVGKMVRGDSNLQFYPYIRMTYQEPGTTTERDAYVASQFVSQVDPNDFAEVNWGSVSVENLGVNSRQWSLHARAVNGGQSWNGQNQVLPGGAIYELNSMSTVVGLVTWQTIMPNEVRNRLAVELGPNEYTLGRAEAAHDSFAGEAMTTLDGLEVYQWVNGDPNATRAWTNNGKSVKVTPGVSLRPLGLTNNASSDVKYQINGDSESNRTMDVTGDNKSANTYFKVFSDTAGTVYMAKSIGNLERLSDVNGFKKQKANVTVTELFKKNVAASAVDALLTGEAKALNDRTKLITNFATALERNTGNDNSASWATDGRWYNEAFDGIYVVRQQTNIQVGFSGVKTLALDPNLTPPSNSKADLFTKAFVSQYKAESSSSTASGSSPGYLANFKGADIRLMNMGEIFSSKKFYIPNALVTDNN